VIPLDLDELLAFAVDVAAGAGRIQMAGLSAAPSITFKSRRELVTPVTHAALQPFRRPENPSM
jgi:hypothetical protein